MIWLLVSIPAECVMSLLVVLVYRKLQPLKFFCLFGFVFLSLKLSNPVLKPLRTYPTETLQYAKTYAENH